MPASLLPSQEKNKRPGAQFHPFWALLMSDEQRGWPGIVSHCVYGSQRVFGGTPMDGMAQEAPCGKWRSPENSCSLRVCVTETEEIWEMKWEKRCLEENKDRI